jgi:hypothetical protein
MGSRRPDEPSSSGDATSSRRNSLEREADDSRVLDPDGSYITLKFGSDSSRSTYPVSCIIVGPYSSVRPVLVSSLISCNCGSMKLSKTGLRIQSSKSQLWVVAQ